MDVFVECEGVEKELDLTCSSNMLAPLATANLQLQPAVNLKHLIYCYFHKLAAMLLALPRELVHKLKCCI